MVNILNEDEFLTSLIEEQVTGFLDTGSHFWGKLLAFNERVILLQGDDGRKIMLRRRTIAQLNEAV